MGMVNDVYRFRGQYIPRRMMSGLERWVKYGKVPGRFLQAVIQNDLKDAFGYADDENFQNIGAYVGWFYNEAPSGCWGSVDAMDKWIVEKNAVKEGH